MINGLVMASPKEVNLFMEQHCKNPKQRFRMLSLFTVELDTYEDLAPGQTVYSWICSGKQIHDTAMTFQVKDFNRKLIYYPVFPDDIGKEILKNAHIPLPPKWSVYANKCENPYIEVHKLNKQLRNLLSYARLFVCMQQRSSSPLPYGFKEVFAQLYANPSDSIDASVVYLINDVIREWLIARGACVYCYHLQDFIAYLHNRYKNLEFVNNDFSGLRRLLTKEYPEQRCYF